MATLDESKKRKAEATEEEPAAKKEAKDSDEKEEDAAADSRPALKAQIGFNSADTTLNVFSAMDNKVLMSLTEGGMQYLIAGARGNVGIKAGRYMYEVKIIEALNPAEASQGMRGPQPRQVVRLGFSPAGSSLILGDSDDGFYFDSDGFFAAGKLRQRKSQTFARDQVVAVVLNLDSSSPNANTISLFRDGVRIAEPQPVPEALRGQPLFPHFSYRNVSLQVNMGPTPFKPLPFECRMLQTAATADVTESKDQPKGGKYEVVVPVAVPDEGTFDWLDDFLQKNPSYVELSDRKILEWATSSGLMKPRSAAGASNDKPTFAFGLPGMDDMSIQRVVKAVTPMVPRNYVIMEVKSNLVKDERAEVLKRFNTPNFKKTAMVVMGQPAGDFKQRSQARILAEKQAKLDNEWQIKKKQKEQQRQVAKKQKELAEARKKAEEQRKKMAEAAAQKKAEEEARKKAEAEGKDVDMEAEKKEEEEKPEDEEKPEVEEEEEDDGLGTEPPKAELTEEENASLFRPKQGSGDLTPAVLSQSLKDFSMPQKAEGFDEVKFAWDPAPKSNDYLRKWVLEAKRTTLLEHLQPSPAFNTRNLAWQKQFTEWQQKQTVFKAKGKQEEGKDNNLDIFSVEDVNDVGEGEPLYAYWEPADWALLQLRYELHLLQDHFKKDVDDPDRVAILESQLNYYYNKYFRTKQLSPGVFGMKNNTELVNNLIKDVLIIGGDPPELTSQLSPDLEVDTADIFVKYTEESRRERKRRAEAGDETTKLKYTPPAAQAIPAPKAAPQQQTPRPQQSGGWGGGNRQGWQGGGGWNRW